jgi:hypothetical protein
MFQLTDRGNNSFKKRIILESNQLHMVYLIYIYIYITIVLFRYLKKKIEDTKRISEVVNRRGTDTTMASQNGQQNKQLSTKTLHKKLTIEEHIATKNSR